jgi:hypothetical protein
MGPRSGLWIQALEITALFASASAEPGPKPDPFHVEKDEVRECFFRTVLIS